MLSSEMIKLDGMLMIGSAGTNVGKTELACALIRKFSKSKPIIGIKVTTIRAKDGQCPAAARAVESAHRSKEISASPRKPTLIRTRTRQDF